MIEVKDIEDIILDSGAVAFAVTDAGRVDEAHLERLDRWLAEGHNAAMAYMANHRNLRANPDALLPGARSVICTAFSYAQPLRRDPGLPRIAEYAYGLDYHDALRNRLQKAAERLSQRFGGQYRVCIDSAPILERYWAEKSGLGSRCDNGLIAIPGFGTKIFLAEILTTLPIKSANNQSANINFPHPGNEGPTSPQDSEGSTPPKNREDSSSPKNCEGPTPPKNREDSSSPKSSEDSTSPKVSEGSTSPKSSEDSTPPKVSNDPKSAVCRVWPLRGPNGSPRAEQSRLLRDPNESPEAGQTCLHCGRCRRACPAGALQPDSTVDARRCLSYLTIEHRGPWDEIGENAMHTPEGRETLYGCDICQQVCPLNQTPGRLGALIPELSPRPGIIEISSSDILAMEQPDFSRIFKGSPIKRAKLDGLRRNAANIETTINYTIIDSYRQL